jgi:hypothetical protein
VPLSPEQRQRVLDAIASRRLPPIPPPKMFAGYGSGRACDGCDQEISTNDIEYEAVYEGDRAYYLHLGCAALWEVGRHRHAESAVEEATDGR